MTCGSCGQTNPEGARFCNECASPLAATCPGCGAENPPGAKFCNQCAAPLGGHETSGSEPDRNPKTYTPKHLAEKILQSKAALEGERKQVTVMFADVKGSMDLASQLDPEVWHTVLDRFFEILTEGVHRFEGTVNQYTGDGIMALFGAPIAHEDHGQRACHSALHLCDVLRTFSDEVRRDYGVDFSTRIGLNSGEVVVGKIGDDLRMDYTAQGHAVGLAQRMEALAENGKPYLTFNTAKLVEGFFELEDLGAFDVKGVEEPMTVYGLLGHGSARTRVERSDGKGLSTFIGRDLEMETLKAAYAESEEGRGQVLGIVAEPGLGKSRLVREFSRYVAEEGGEMYAVHNPSHGKDVPLSGYLSVFRTEFKIAPQDSPETAREKIRQRFKTLYQESTEFYPFVCDFLGMPDPDHPLPAMSAEQRQQRLIEYERSTLAERTRKEFAVIILEDLHWADSMSEAIYDININWTPSERQLIVCTYRPEYTPPWASKSFYQQLPLRPLREKATITLIAELLGPALVNSDVAGAIRERCGGVPFFVEETVQSLAESGVLTGERGAYTTDQSVQEIPFPATVQSVLDARIDRLAEEQKQVVQTASVIGRVFSRAVLQTVVGMDDHGLDGAIDTLRESEFIFEESRHPEIEYSFKHALTQDAAYRSQLSERRKEVHALVARIYEAHFESQLDEKAAQIARHHEEAGEGKAAAHWHTRAAAWASRTDWAQGNWHWRRVLDLTYDLPESDERDQLRLDAVLAVFATGWRLRLSAEQVEPLFEEGRRLCRRKGDREHEIHLLGNWGFFRGNDGDARSFYSLAKEGCALLDENVSVEAHVHVRRLGAYSAYCVGNLPEALDHIDEVIRLSEGDRELGRATMGFPTWSMGWHFRAQCLNELGRLDEARAAVEKLHEILRGEPWSEVNAWVAGDLIRLAKYAGWEQDQAEYDFRPRCSEAIEYSERIGSDFVRGTSLRDACGAHILAGDYERAVEMGREALAVARGHKVLLQETGYLCDLLSEALLGAGLTEEALKIANSGVESSEEHGLRFQEALCRLARVRALREANDTAPVEEVERDLERTEVLIEETGGRALLPQLVEERARLSTLLELDPRPELEEAIDLYHEIGAAGHAKRLATEIGKMRT